MNNSEEIWKDVIGYEGFYQVSNFGRVKRLARTTINRGTPLRLQEKMKILSPERDGYVRVNLLKKSFSVHRLVAQHFISNTDNKKEVNHKDLNKSNNQESNLEWVTPVQNVLHKMKIYAEQNNGKHWKSKLNSENVSFIRAAFKNTHTAKELSEKFNLDLSTVYYILRNECWKHTNDKGTVFKRN